MATVYLADDLKHERKVAIKVLRPELAAALGPERFLREIEIAAQLQHPHILPLLDSGERRRLPLLRHALRRGANRSATGSPARASCRCTKRCGSSARWSTRSGTRTAAAWCIATSSPTT